LGLKRTAGTSPANGLARPQRERPTRGAPAFPSGVYPHLNERAVITLCSTTSSVNTGDRAVRIVTLRCKSWGCDECQPRRKSQLIALAKSGKPDTFITLTVNPETNLDQARRARALARAWPIVVKRAKKKYGYKSIPYLCVFEATKKGEPHLHILCRVKWIDQRWLSDQMRGLINAPICDIRRVRSTDQAAHYISKYIGKEPGHFNSCKRYWRTQDYELTKYVPDTIEGDWSETWTYYAWSKDVMQGMYEFLGFRFEQAGGMAIGRQLKPPWNRHSDAGL